MKLFTLGVALLLGLSLQAQRDPNQVPCLTNEKSEWLVRYQKGLIPVAPKSAVTTYVPLRIIVVGEDNGDGYVDPTLAVDAFDLLNEDFFAQDIQFYLSEPVAFVDNSVYYDHDSEGGNAMMENESVENTINCFIVANPRGACGYFSGRGDAIVLDKDCIGPGDRTWSHEMGHYLSLPHTFFGWESVGDIAEVRAFNEPAPTSLSFGNGFTVLVEKMDSSNCTEAADGFCDTPPDYLPERWPCNTRGFYRDSLLDPDSIRFAVPANNIMSYANDGCVFTFSNDQQTAMRTRLSNRSDLDSEFQPIENDLNGRDITHVSPAQNEDIEFSDFVELVWTSDPDADFYIVQINANAAFGGNVTGSYVTTDTSIVINDPELLDEERRYYWRVRPVNAYRTNETYSATTRFRNGSFTTSTIDAQLDAGITVSPNPVSDGQDLRVIGRDLGTSGSMSYEVIGANGRVIIQQPSVPVINQGFRVNIPTDQLKRGVYFLRIQLDGRLVTRRFVK